MNEGWMATQAARIEQWPRIRRIVLSLVFAVVMTVLVFVALAMMLDTVENITVVMWVSMGCGLVAYLVGWWALVGFDSETRLEWHAGPQAVWVVILTAVGAVAMVFVIVAAMLSLM